MRLRMTLGSAVQVVELQRVHIFGEGSAVGQRAVHSGSSNRSALIRSGPLQVIKGGRRANRMATTVGACQQILVRAGALAKIIFIPLRAVPTSI